MLRYYLRRIPMCMSKKMSLGTHLVLLVYYLITMLNFDDSSFHRLDTKVAKAHCAGDLLSLANSNLTHFKGKLNV